MNANIPKISVMHLTYDMRIGGTEMVIKNIIQGSDENHFEMSIFCVEEPLGPWGIELQNTGIKITIRSRKPGFDASLITALRQHIKRNKINLLHCHQYTPWAYGVMAAFGTKTKVIFTEHGRFYPDSSNWKRKLINPWLCRITDHITSISKATKQALVQFENIPEKRIEVVYNGISPIQVTKTAESIKKHLTIPENRVVFGTVARFDSIKNHPMMLNAIKILIDKNIDIHLVIVGDGETRPSLETLIREYNLSTRVTLTGYIQDPSNYINMFDIYLLTSFSEGTSMTLLEAMSVGKPCIVTDVGGNPEVIVNQSNGVVVPSDDSDALAREMEVLLSSDSIRHSMSLMAIERFNSIFCATSMNTRFSEIYSRLTGL